MERSSRVLHHGNPKIWFFFQKKFEFWFLTKSWNHLSFVNVSPTLVIDTSMEWSSRVLHYENLKIWFFFQKVRNWRIEFCPYPEFPYAEKRNRPGFVNISPTKVIDTSTERSSRVLQHEKQEIWFFFFFSKKFEIEFDLYFDLCWRAEIIQVGLNMHLYVDIGDASSSLWGSTFSCFLVTFRYYKYLSWLCRSNIGWQQTIFLRLLDKRKKAILLFLNKSTTIR